MDDIQKLIMTIRDKIADEKLQYDARGKNITVIIWKN